MTAQQFVIVRPVANVFSSIFYEWNDCYWTTISALTSISVVPSQTKTETATDNGHGFKDQFVIARYECLPSEFGQQKITLLDE